MWKKLPFKGLIYASLAINIVSVLLILTVQRLLPPVVPLFYGLPYGQDQLVPSVGLFIVPGACLLVIVLNAVLSGYFNDQFYKKTLIISAALISVLGVITVLKIIFLVGLF